VHSPDDLLTELRSAGHRLDDGRVAVPEHAVKPALAAAGVRVPPSVVVGAPAEARTAAAGLAPPLVLKAYGPGLLHKTDVGAVRLGLQPGDLGPAAASLVESLRAQGLVAAGLLVEEQQEAGVELLVGVLRRRDFGPVITLGPGGTLTELIQRTVTRLCPLDEAAAGELLDAFPVPALLEGARGRPPVDRSALIRLLLALAGPGGLVERLGGALDELECNPVIASADGAVAVDARLVLRNARDHTAPEPLPAAAPWSFDRLFAPRSIVVVGASTTRLAFGNRFLRAYRGLGWRDGLYALHRDAAEVEGVPAVKDLAEVGGPVDYLLVAVPATVCASVVRHAAGRAAFAQVMTAGFGESGDEGAELERELLRAGRESQVRIVGPNCMGVYAPAGRQAFQLRDPTEAGTVGVVSQSGGLAGDIIKAGASRGVRFSKLATIGNAVDVSAAELIDYFVDDPATEVIGGYVEGAADGAPLVTALRRASGIKPVVLLVGGSTRTGGRAVVSHTGALTATAGVWEAIAVATGATIVTTLEDLVAVLAYLQRYAGEAVDGGDGDGDGDVLVIGPGGGASILSADASDRNRVPLAPVATAAQDRLRAMGYGVGTSLANPIEIPIGPGVERTAFDPVLDTILATQRYSDVILHINVHSFYSQGERGADPLLEMLEHLAGRAWPARLAVTLRNLDCAPGPDVDLVKLAAARGRLPWFRSFDEALIAVRAAQRLRSPGVTRGGETRDFRGA
jgi:acyl-CoA synthetase (NDP forming)